MYNYLKHTEFKNIKIGNKLIDDRPSLKNGSEAGRPVGGAAWGCGVLRKGRARTH